MKVQYLIRLDDACPTMDAAKWQRMEDILDAASIRPMVGVIPANADQDQRIDEEDAHFWNKVRKWESKQWAIALHGYDHVYRSDRGLEGLNPLWKRSEFAGVSLEKQKKRFVKVWKYFVRMVSTRSTSLHQVTLLIKKH